MLSLTSLGCNPPTNRSQVKHVFGEVRVDSARNACQEKPDAKYADAQSYLRQILLEIARANSETFRDDLAAEAICIGVRIDSKLNATAFIDKNSIVVNSGTILAAATDADVASSVAHEMAHLAMMSNHKIISDYLVTDPAWPAFRIDYDQKLTALKAVEKLLVAEMREVKTLRSSAREM